MTLSEIQFQRDKVYSRRADIHDKFGGQMQGGISTPKDVPAIFLFTGDTGEQYGYRDGPDESGVFLYTGEGQEGDMEFLRGNQAIRDHAKNNKTLFVFESLGKGMGCRFIGEYSCSNFEYRRAPDRNNNERRVIVFHLVPVGEETLDAGAGEFDQATTGGASLDDLRKRAYQALSAAEGPAGRDARRTQYVRSAAVRSYVLARANGRCECCLAAAPFIRRDGSPYLEPHHTTRLSDAGLDHPAHVAAVCPTCHREIHYGRGGDDKNARLSERIVEFETAPRA